MRKRLLATTCFLLISVSLSMAQAAASISTAPTKADVLKFMDLMQLKARVTQMLEGITTQARLGAEAGFKQKVPNATPEQLAKVDALADAIFKDMPVDEMLDAMVPIYQKHLSKADLNAIIAFYASPVGQKLLKEQPAMMAEGMQVGGEIGQKKVGDMMERLERQVAQLAVDEQAKQPSQEQEKPQPKN